MNKIKIAIVVGTVITAATALAVLAHKKQDVVDTIKTNGKKLASKLKRKADDAVDNVELTAEQLAEMLRSLNSDEKD